MQKRILIIGASVLQLPAVIRAKELGYYVGLVDFNPYAVAIPYADEYFNVSTIDAEGVTNVSKKFMPDGIMTLATDMPMRALAKATAALGLPGISEETAKKATDKGEMIKAFKEHNVESPWYFILKDEKDLKSIRDKIKFPCIVKPTDNAGSRGVILVRNIADIDDAYNYSRKQSRSGDVVIEEYMQGPEVSVETMTVKGNVTVLAVTDKLTTGAPHFVELGHCQQSQLPSEDILKIKDLAARAVVSLGIDTGPSHVEIILTKEGPKMVELGARMGGDCITTHLVPLSTGIDMVESTIRLACGENIDLEPKLQKGSAIRFFQTKKGVLNNITGTEKARKLEGVKEICFTKNIGDVITDIYSSVDRVGYVIAQANTAKEAVSICEKAMSMIKFDIQ